ncbi:MAG: GntR family transcriptional regulator [Firmicutes bacterium]|nr:GntR family transcriptional regulator [Bacillota bacterium]
MKLDFDSGKPIFLQIAENIQDAVLSGAFPEGEQIPSITELSASLKINPATALKGVNLLVDEGIVYKKRGVGMFVSSGATEKLRDIRQQQFYDNFISGLVAEAKRLGLTAEDVKELIERGFKE